MVGQGGTESPENVFRGTERNTTDEMDAGGLLLDLIVPSHIDKLKSAVFEVSVWLNIVDYSKKNIILFKDNMKKKEQHFNRGTELPRKWNS
jgi:hypothetical protein